MQGFNARQPQRQLKSIPEILSLLHLENRWDTQDTTLNEILEDFNSDPLLNNKDPLGLLKILLSILSVAKMNYENEWNRQSEFPAKERRGVRPPWYLYDSVKNLMARICQPLAPEVRELIDALYIILSDGPPDIRQETHRAITVPNHKPQQALTLLAQRFPEMMGSIENTPKTRALLQTLLCHGLSEALTSNCRFSSELLNLVQTTFQWFPLNLQMTLLEMLYDAMQKARENGNLNDFSILLKNISFGDACLDRVEEIILFLNNFTRIGQRHFPDSPLPTTTLIYFLQENNIDRLLSLLRENIKNPENNIDVLAMDTVIDFYSNFDFTVLESLKQSLEAASLYDSDNFLRQTRASLHQWLNICDGENYLLQDLCAAINSNDESIVPAAIDCLREHKQILSTFRERIIESLAQAMEADGYENNRRLLAEVHAEFERLNPQPAIVVHPINPIAQAAPPPLQGNLFPTVQIGAMFMGAPPAAQPQKPLLAALLLATNPPPPPGGRGNVL